jgi:hypothetical protein
MTVIKRHSTKKYKKKKSTDTTKKAPAKARRVQDNNPAITSKLIYTYVLKDLIKLIYKIGKTTNPHARFKNLCVRGKVVPIALVKKDIEEELHKRYAENRIFNEDYKYNGGTEWFKSGGKFDEFILAIDKGQVLPFITLHSMVAEFIEENIIKVSDSNTEWELTQSKYAYYFIGLEILLMLGYVSKIGSNGLLSKDPENILLLGRKISISETILNNIKGQYLFYVSTSLKSHLIIDNKSEKSRTRKIDLKSSEFDSEIFLLLNKVL